MKLKLTRADMFSTNPRYRVKCEEAALDWAAENTSDPHCNSRTMNELRRGTVHASDVSSDARQLRGARLARLKYEEPERERTALALKKYLGLVPMEAV